MFFFTKSDFCKNALLYYSRFNFELSDILAESDTEFGPTTYSPLKIPNRIVTVKTLEEIKLEKIQAESAAFYSYNGKCVVSILK